MSASPDFVRAASPLDITIVSDQTRVAPGDTVEVTVAVSNQSTVSLKFLDVSFGSPGFTPVEWRSGSVKLNPGTRISPRSSILGVATAKAQREGEHRMTLRVRYSVLTPRGSVSYADVVQSPAIVVTSAGAPAGAPTTGYFPVMLGAALAVGSVLLLDVLRRTGLWLANLRRARSLLLVTVTLTLQAVQNEEAAPADAWETLLLNDGYAGPLDAWGRLRVRGPSMSVQIAELYGVLLQFNKRRGRGDQDLREDLLGKLEALQQALKKL